MLLALKYIYKTKFSTILGQFCYQRIEQGLTEAPEIYSRLKDLALGFISSLSAESVLAEELSTIVEYFLDNDQEISDTISEIIDFLHNYYFLRYTWAGLTLSSPKSRFFCNQIGILGYQCTRTNIRPSANKLDTIASWPEPTTAEKLAKFLYILPFLRIYLPGQADLSRIMRTAVRYKRKETKKYITGFTWGEPQQQTFLRIKKIIAEAELIGEDTATQYYLATDISGYGSGKILFQIIDSTIPSDTKLSKQIQSAEQIVIFLSFVFNNTQIRYDITEREVLAVLNCLEKVR